MSEAGADAEAVAGPVHAVHSQQSFNFQKIAKTLKIICFVEHLQRPFFLL